MLPGIEWEQNQIRSDEGPFFVADISRARFAIGHGYRILQPWHGSKHVLGCATRKAAHAESSGVSRQTPASRRGPLKGLGTDAAQVTVAAGSIVKSFDVIEYI